MYNLIKINGTYFIRVISVLVVTTSFYYIFNRLRENYNEIILWEPMDSFYWLIGFCIIAYGLSGFLLSHAWWKLVGLFGNLKFSQIQCFKVYGTSQIAKYIPGNIFHFAGRYVLGQQVGIGKLPLIGSSFFEVIGLVLITSIFSLIGFIFQSYFTQEVPISSIYIIFGVTLLLLIALFLLPKLAKERRIKIPVTDNYFVVHLLSIYFDYVVFFLLSGIILNIVIYAISGNISLDYLLIISIFSISWIIGFVTPGLSAGIGVREAIIILLLTPAIGETMSLVVALTTRIVTVVGDMLFFLLSYFLSGSQNEDKV